MSQFLEQLKNTKFLFMGISQNSPEFAEVRSMEEDAQLIKSLCEINAYKYLPGRLESFKLDFNPDKSFEENIRDNYFDYWTDAESEQDVPTFESMSGSHFAIVTKYLVQDLNGFTVTKTERDALIMKNEADEECIVFPIELAFCAFKVKRI